MAMTMCRPEKAALTGLAGALLLAALTALSADPDAAYLADLRRSLRLLERDAVLQLRGLDKLEQSRRKRAGELAQKEMQLFSEIEQQDDRQRRKELLEELRKCQSELRVEREQIAGIVEHQRPRMEKEIVEARQAMELKRDVLSGKKEPPIRYCPVHGQRLRLQHVGVWGPADVMHWKPQDVREMKTKYPHSDQPYVKGGVRAWTDEDSDLFMEWVCPLCAEGRHRWLEEKGLAQP
jgi:hypothetical protein